MNDLTGQQFGRWTVLEAAANYGRRNAMVRARCECGRQKEVNANNLRRGLSKSCGCLSRERSAQQLRKHGGSRDPEYDTWRRMKQRCGCPGASYFALYGGRGIRVCDRWLNSYETFLADMGRRPSPEHSLDRIDTNGDYEPGNVRWATATEQARNRRRNVLLTVNEETLTLPAWAERAGINPHTLRKRLRLGWTPAEALLRAVRR